MSPVDHACARAGAVERAALFSPFLRDAMEALPDLKEKFLQSGARAAVDLALERRDEEVEIELRRQRHGLALATALGDLSGDLPLEEVTALLTTFADSAIDRALRQTIAE